MARVKTKTLIYDDTGLMNLLENLGPNSAGMKIFLKRAMGTAADRVKKMMAEDAISVGYPVGPATMECQGPRSHGRKYKVLGRVPRKIKRGRFVLKRKGSGDTSQRVIIGGGVLGAPHANITRYSKNVERFTKKGYSRGKFRAIPFVAQTTARSQGVVYESIHVAYRKFLAEANRDAKRSIRARAKGATT